MRILANENLPRPVVAALRDAGHDVAWVRESMPGAADTEVLAVAQAEHRIVLTVNQSPRHHEPAPPSELLGRAL